MNSFSAGFANRSIQSDGFTPVSQWSNAISFASCHPGCTRCTSRPISSKQNKKNKCGYQNLQKCQTLCDKVGQTFLSVSLLASTPHKTKITAATKACVLIK